MSLTIVARSRLFIPTLYLFIVIIFFTVAFFAYGAKFFFENFIYAWALQLGIMIDMSTPPPFAAFPSQWMKHGSFLRKGASKNIKVFIVFRFTEFEKMLPFCKNISVFVYRSRQSDESIAMWVRRGGTRGRLQGVHNPPSPPPPEMTCGFLIQLVFCKKKLCGLLVLR